jgi:mono/diheme cytochrome c family protein
MRMSLVLFFAIVFSAQAPGAEPQTQAVDYVRDVKPIFARRCLACHGILKQKAGLRLDTAARLLRGAKNGPVIAPGKSGESLLIDAVLDDEESRMPPEGEGERLSSEEVRILRAWIDQGATPPREEQEPTDPRSHWAYRAPRSASVPKVRNHDWVKNPIDAFLATAHEARGLQPVSRADKGVLIRRVYFDLIGLAPSPAEVKAFVGDTDEDAYEHVVDRLLGSPQHGERWGRHWMDVWRYSDWDGFGAEVRESQPHIWRWRDWIVESINADKGYDRMIVEMLAADEAAPGDGQALRATGFLVRNWYKFSRNVWIDNTIEHTSKAFLGITVNCARCHDHKYDPISQTEYYRFRAFFEPHEIRTERLPGQPDTAKAGLACVYDAKPEEPTYLFTRGNEKDPEKTKPLKPGIPAIFGRADLPAATVTLPLEVYSPGLRPFVREEILAEARGELDRRAAELAKAAKGSPAAALAEKAQAAALAAITAAEARIAADVAKLAQPPRTDAPLLARLAAMAERQATYLKAEHAFANTEAALSAARDAVKPAPSDAAKKAVVADAEKQQTAARTALDAARTALAKADAAYTPLGPTYPATSTGRRLALARWISSRENPLVARVAVNHIWMRHFGTPLVSTVSDFGSNGKPPTHPELLDWLAVEFMDRGWSLKAIHRLIVTSQAYQMHSTAEDASAADLTGDPENRFLWRQNPRRMEAEAVRDNVLAVVGALDPAVGGPDLDPALGETSPRRSLYFRHAKEKRMTFLRLFDSPSVVSCYRRSESVVPQQALALVNSTLTLEKSRLLARKLSNEIGEGDDARFANEAFTRILGRSATDQERVQCLDFLAATPDKQTARSDLVHVLFNHNDFVTIR